VDLTFLTIAAQIRHWGPIASVLGHGDRQLPQGFFRSQQFVLLSLYHNHVKNYASTMSDVNRDARGGEKPSQSLASERLELVERVLF
jgi:hypothetical protein